MKNFFYFNSGNRRAIIFLSIIIVGVHFFMKMSANKSIKQYDFSRFQQEIKEFKIDQQIEKQKKSIHAKT